MASTFKSLLKMLTLAYTPQTTKNTAVEPQDQTVDQLNVSIPPSSLLLRLADSNVQDEVRMHLAQIGAHPTPAQWEMILASTSSTCVIAGAGSGKSTTLILRLLVLHKVLNISWEEMHVFSFTRASTEDFQNKLAEKLILWEEVIEQTLMTDQRRMEIKKSVKRTVSTFHSVIMRLRGDVLPDKSSCNLFDLLGKVTSDEEDASNYNPFVSANLSDQQDEILNMAHTQAYLRFPRYKEIITFLVQEQERRQWLSDAQTNKADEQMEMWKWTQLLRQERAYHGFTYDEYYAPLPTYRDQHRNFAYIDPYRAAVADRLHELGVQFSTFETFPIRSPLPGLSAGKFYAPFKIGERLYIHIKRYQPPFPKQSSEKKLSFHERDRHRFIALYSENADQHKMLEPEDFAQEKGHLVIKPNGDYKLQRWLNLHGYAFDTISAPPVRIQLPGEIHPIHIAELLYQEGIFIESMGLEVEQIHLHRVGLDAISSAIGEALPLFWQTFQAELEKRSMVRFHNILTVLRDEQILRLLPDKLTFLRHLFIDEFQDISPELVNWLAKTIRVQAQGGADVSVIAIGDDYQSIYGWRGSHPIFLMQFERYFPSQQVGKIVLEENFRSRQPIIDAAEAVLEPVKHKIAKHGKSASLINEDQQRHPVRLVETQHSWETHLWQTFCIYSAELLHHLEEAGDLSQLLNKRRTLSIFILSRTNITLSSIPETRRLKSQLLQALHQQGVKQFQDMTLKKLTFHRAKGLEADVVLLLDDSQPPDKHDLRELIFSQTLLLGQDAGTYKQTMADETRRLAYVALTRARLGAMWIPLRGSSQANENDAQPRTNTTAQSTASVSPEGCFVLVKKHLQAPKKVPG